MNLVIERQDEGQTAVVALRGELDVESGPKLREALLDAIGEGDGLDLSSVRMAHPRLGELDAYQWILFVAHHETRHVRQLERLHDALAGSVATDERA